MPGLTNWQLFFRDLQNATEEQPLSDNEVLTVVRSVINTVYMMDTSSYVTVGTPETRAGYAQVGLSEVG